MNELEYLSVDLEPADARAAARSNLATGCLLHGFGSGADDLLPLAREIGGVSRWYALQAPVEVVIEGAVLGRAWFPRDPEEVRKALYGGYFRELRNMEPGDLAESAEAVRAFLDARGTDWKRTVIVGFSQGAMVATELLRQGVVHGEALPAATVLLSGGLVAERWWDETTRAADEKSAPIPLPPVFQSHGRYDRILAVGEGAALRDTLRRAGFSVQWMEFPGDHSVVAEVIQELRGFMSKIG